jgi:hypothetical protein
MATAEFLTIHELISAVHPWLMGLRENSLQAAGNLQDNVPFPSKHKVDD